MIYDFDYISGGRREGVDDRPLLYVYKSGIRRSEVFAALSERSKAALQKVWGDSAVEVLTGLNLFSAPKSYVLDLGSDWGDDTLSLVVKAIAREGSDVAALFLHERPRYRRGDTWRTLEGMCAIVREPSVTAATLKPILRSFQQTTDLGRHAQILDRPEFFHSFKCFVEESASLAELKSEFDIRLCLVDSDEDRGVDASADNRQRPAPNSLRSLLTTMLVDQNESALTKLTASVSERVLSGAATSTTYRGLRQSTALILEKLLQPDRTLRTSELPAPLPALLWASIVLAQGERIAFASRPTLQTRSPATGVMLVDHLGSEFVRRIQRSSPLEGLWTVLSSALSKALDPDADVPLTIFRLAGALAACVQALEPTALPLWAQKLRQLVSQSRMKFEAKPASKVEFEPFALKSFKDVIGNAAAVKALRQRVIKHSRQPLIIFGKRGVGKRTLAVLYAKARVCEAPVDGDACGLCTECGSFDEGRSISVAGPFEVNDKAEQVLQKLVELRETKIAPKRTIILSGLGTCPPEVFDVLLKTLEKPRDVVYILIAERLKDVRIAGQSRSQALAVRPLDAGESQSFLRNRLQHIDLIDEGLLSAFAVRANGLPHELEEICTTIESRHWSTAEQLLAGYSLDWRGELPAIIKARAGQFDTAEGSFVCTEPARRSHEFIRAAIQAYIWQHCGYETDSDITEPLVRGLTRTERMELSLQLKIAFCGGTVEQFDWPRLGAALMREHHQLEVSTLVGDEDGGT